MHFHSAITPVVLIHLRKISIVCVDPKKIPTTITCGSSVSPVTIGSMRHVLGSLRSWTKMTPTTVQDVRAKEIS
jgi:hypothetical protein